MTRKKQNFFRMEKFRAWFENSLKNSDSHKVLEKWFPSFDPDDLRCIMTPFSSACWYQHWFPKRHFPLPRLNLTHGFFLKMGGGGETNMKNSEWTTFFPLPFSTTYFIASLTSAMNVSFSALVKGNTLAGKTKCECTRHVGHVLGGGGGNKK